MEYKLVQWTEKWVERGAEYSQIYLFSHTIASLLCLGCLSKRNWEHSQCGTDGVLHLPNVLVENFKNKELLKVQTEHSGFA